MKLGVYSIFKYTLAISTPIDHNSYYIRKAQILSMKI